MDSCMHIQIVMFWCWRNRRQRTWVYHPVTGQLSCHSTGMAALQIVALEVALVNLQESYTMQCHRRMVAQFSYGVIILMVVLMAGLLCIVLV